MSFKMGTFSTFGTAARTLLLLGVLLLVASGCATREGRVVERGTDAYSNVIDAGGWVSTIASAAAAALLILGWKVYNWVITLPGAILGGIIGAAAAGGDAELPFLLVAILGGAALGGLLASLLHALSIFGAGVLLATVIIQGFWGDLLGTEPPANIAVFGAIAGGVLLSIFFRYITVLVAAALGVVLLRWTMGIGVGWMVVLFLGSIWLQAALAQSMGENAFTRRKVEKPRRSAAATLEGEAESQPTFLPKEKRKTSAEDYFDPNAEMGVYEE